MLISEIKTLLDAQYLTGEKWSNLKVEAAFSCDLMSDALAFVDNNVLLLTGLTNPQVIRTAEMLDLNAIVFVRGKEPERDVIQMAEDMNIVLLSTRHSMYTSSGVLFSKGLNGICIGGTKSE